MTVNEENRKKKKKDYEDYLKDEYGEKPGYNIVEPKKVKEKMREYKKCTKCGKIKPRSEFYKDGTKKNGLRSACKDCEWYKNPKKYKNSKRYKNNMCPYCGWNFNGSMGIYRHINACKNWCEERRKDWLKMMLNPDNNEFKKSYNNKWYKPNKNIPKSIHKNKSSKTLKKISILDKIKNMDPRLKKIMDPTELGKLIIKEE